MHRAEEHYLARRACLEGRGGSRRLRPFRRGPPEEQRPGASDCGYISRRKPSVLGSVSSFLERKRRSRPRSRDQRGPGNSVYISRRKTQVLAQVLILSTKSVSAAVLTIFLEGNDLYRRQFFFLTQIAGTEPNALFRSLGSKVSRNVV